VNSLYSRLVLEYSRARRHAGALGAPTHSADGANPLCGDAIRVELRCDGAHVAEFGFSGESCAVATATASMLGDLVGGRGREEIEALAGRFERLVETGGEDPGLGPLNAMRALRDHPSRRKCALLPWATLRAALAGRASATTEGNPRMTDVSAPFRFRPATPGDVPAIVALVESAYRGDASRQGWTTEADMLDGQRTDPAGVAEIVAKSDGLVLLAEDDSGILACAQIETVAGDGGATAGYFGMFSVRPAQQGAGVGRAVLAEAERIARGRGCTEMQMTVISIRDELIAWYERRGYRRTGRYKPFPYGDERFGIPKRDDLRFELLVKPL